MATKKIIRFEFDCADNSTTPILPPTFHRHFQDFAICEIALSEIIILHCTSMQRPSCPYRRSCAGHYSLHWPPSVLAVAVIHTHPRQLRRTAALASSLGHAGTHTSRSGLAISFCALTLPLLVNARRSLPEKAACAIEPAHSHNVPSDVVAKHDAIYAATRNKQ